MCHNLHSACCGATVCHLEGLPAQLQEKVESLYHDREPELIGTCFCYNCGQEVCLNCM